jgi:hypothetical protein
MIRTRLDIHMGGDEERTLKMKKSDSEDEEHPSV